MDWLRLLPSKWSLQAAGSRGDGRCVAAAGMGQLWLSPLLGRGVWGWCHHPMELSSQLGWQVPFSSPSRASRRTRARQGCAGSPALAFPLLEFVAHSGTLKGNRSTTWSTIIFRNTWDISFHFLMVTMRHYQRQKTAGNVLLFKIQQLSSLCITNSRRNN